MTTNHQDVTAFHNTFDVDSAWAEDSKLRLNPKVLDLRISLIREEQDKELLPALERLRNFPSLENLTEVADGLVDSVYVILGTAIALDLPWQELWNEVQRSNMAKVYPDGSVHRREDGKILKPEGWTPPDLFPIILRWYEQRCIQDNPELWSQYAMSTLRETLTAVPNTTDKNSKAV